jgi:hypothetical protein
MKMNAERFFETSRTTHPRTRVTTLKIGDLRNTIQTKEQVWVKYRERRRE